MSVNVQVKMTVPLDQVDECSSQIVFCRWLPGEGEALIYTDDGFTVRYWADFDCLNHLGEIMAEEIPQTITIMVEKVQTLADFVVENEKLEALAEPPDTSLPWSDDDGRTQSSSPRRPVGGVRGCQ